MPDPICCNVYMFLFLKCIYDTNKLKNLGGLLWSRARAVSRWPEENAANSSNFFQQTNSQKPPKSSKKDEKVHAKYEEA